MTRAARERMTPNPLGLRRLAAQQIAPHTLSKPSDVVAWLGAVQAQDYAATKWAVGLRLADGAASDAKVEQALADGAILRTHALRGTWQLVTPEDIRWVLALVTPRLVDRSSTRNRQLGLDAATFRKSNAVMEKALRGGTHLTRAELAAALAQAGISSAGARLSHLLARAELEALICSGARRGKQSTYALLDHRAPASTRPRAREEALAELARRYFRSRGPATVHDFSIWSGLAVSDARAGLESVQATLVSETFGGRTYWHHADRQAVAGAKTAHLLPAFDEYLVSYKDRSAVLDPKHVKRLNAGGGMLDPCIVVEGRVVATWRRTLARSIVAIEVDAFDATTRRAREAIVTAAHRYGAFLGLEARVAYN